VLAGALALAQLGWIAPGAQRAQAAPRFSRDPFALGVASGAPGKNDVVLWTRLAPNPTEDGGGMAPEPVPVAWEAAADERFQRIVARGAVTAQPQRAHAVHVVANGLQPGRPYWYRFMSSDAVSATGRTRTMPAGSPTRLRFCFASCQHYETGFYGAYRHMAADDPDLVVFLGDYIYEVPFSRAKVRAHEAATPRTLAEYRARHATYKSDPDLQRMHALAPWLVTWDDHEVENDYADARSETLDPNFLVRRAAAYQAYFEHMPLRPMSTPNGPSLRMYDRYSFGDLARFHVLDDRQYRSPQPCPMAGYGGSNIVEHCPERLDPQATLLGAEQERWLHQGLMLPGVRWNVLAQQTLMTPLNRKREGEGQAWWTDGWDGYPAARRRLLDFMATQRPVNPVVIGGDVHSSVVADLRPDLDDPRSPVVAAEICGTSVTSLGPPADRMPALIARNPHLRHLDTRRRGYVRVDVTSTTLLAALRVVDNARVRETGVTTSASFVVEAGRPGLQAG
jgi:alkaline phosphatase D